MLCARAKYSVTRALARSSTPSRSMYLVACSAETHTTSPLKNAAHVAASRVISP